jgi:anti-anti-sigma regulatory factor
VPSPSRDEQPVCGYAADLRAGDPDTWTIALQGQVDADAITRLQDEMTVALTGYDRIVVDLRDVSLLSAPTFARLCCALRRAHHPDATLVIAHAAPAARRAFQLCELPGVELHPRGTSRPPGDRRSS